MLMKKSNVNFKRTTRVVLIVLVGVACFALLPITQAVSPPPDGGYPGGNTAEGKNALLSLTTGGFNTAIGFFSLRSNATNGFNTAIGAGALFANTADQNTATGAAALFSNTSGESNTAAGAFALFSNDIGSSNTATGETALFENTSGFGNTAIGAEALKNNTNTNFNTAIGVDALVLNTGRENTAVGVVALAGNTTGNLNTALGDTAGSSLTTGSSNICIGAGVTGVEGESNTIRIGDNLPETGGDSACYIGGIAGQTVDPMGAGQVYIDNAGKLGVILSSRRFKHDISPMDASSGAILKLNPVAFYYKSDTKNTPCYGLIAEEVAEVNPDLVVRDKEGKPYTVRYDAVNAMLLNEFLKEHNRVKAQQARIAQLETAFSQQEKNFTEQKKQIQALVSGLHRVTPELELRTPALQTALHNQ